MTSAGEVIAILGLFERVAIELRNYKDAPAHFQHLGVELDLLRSTLRHALQLRPENDDERRTLDKVGAIATHCLQPLQALAEKMRAKESSLGHFRTTGSLVNIGTRVHWSLIARKDVDELRKVILAEMVAINMLLSAQQLNQIKRLSSDIKGMESAQSALIEQHSNALMQQTSSILSIVTTTPIAIADLRAVTIAHAAKQSVEGQVLQRGLEAVTKHLEALSVTTKSTWAVARQHAGAMARMVKRLSALMRDIRELFIFLATCSKEMLAAIGRNTRLLLHIADQMKRVVQAIEAMPRSPGVDIIRLDDALGETWGLPLQACGSWTSFCDMLRHVVFVAKPGLDHVTSGRFVITLAKTGQRLDSRNWIEFMKRDVHIEQAMIVTSPRHGPMGCPFPGCDGPILSGRERGKTCPTCGRQTSIRKAVKSVVQLRDWRSAPSPAEAPPNMLPKPPGKDLPPIQIMGDGFEHFRRVHVQEYVRPIQNNDEAFRRLAEDMSDATAHAFIGAEMLSRGEPDGDTDKGGDDSGVYFRGASKWLKAAVKLEPDVAEHWYLLGRANVSLGNHVDAYNALQQAVYRDSTISAFWNTIAILYRDVNQIPNALDSIKRAIQVNPLRFEYWYNQGVLYDACTARSSDAIHSFRKCLDICPGLAQVEARLKLLKAWSDKTPPVLIPEYHRIYRMLETKLRGLSDEESTPEGSRRVINSPVQDDDSRYGQGQELDHYDTSILYGDPASD